MKEKAIFWYKQLHFPKEYDEAFYALAEGADLSAVDVENPIAEKSRLRTEFDLLFGLLRGYAQGLL